MSVAIATDKQPDRSLDQEQFQASFPLIMSHCLSFCKFVRAQWLSLI